MSSMPDAAAPRVPQEPRNVLGHPLVLCGCDPVTGFVRDGYCLTGPRDVGVHTVCAIMTGDFLEFTRSRGNDLTTPRPEWDFPGLKPGDRWCLCARRWMEAANSGVAPRVILGSTNETTLEIVPLELLRAHAQKETAA